jgi:dihydroorotase
MQEAAFGISGLETAFGLVNGLVDRGDIDLPTAIERLTAGPARVLGESYQANIGTLMPGASGDVTVLDTDTEWVVDSSTFASKGRNTPVDGITLKGQVVKTIVGGRLVHDLQETAAKGSA